MAPLFSPLCINRHNGWDWVRNMTCPEGDRGTGLSFPFNQTWPILLKWSSAGSVKLKAASHGLEFQTIAPLVLGLWGFYVALRQLNTSRAVTPRNLQSFGFSIEFNIYIFQKNVTW